MKSSTMGYSSIPSTDDSIVNNGGQRFPHNDDEQSPSRRTSIGIMVGGVALLALIVSGSVVSGGKRVAASTATDTTSLNGPFPLPFGVNLASWLSLEDYFFVGTGGAVEVATPDDVVAAKCLPPLHTGPSTGPGWNSETDLFGNLTQMVSVEHAIRTFHAFRVSYLDWDEELPKIAALGIHWVRVPVSWCLTDHDPTQDDILVAGSDGSDDDKLLLERFTCKDPFFEQEGVDVYWPAVPRSFLQNFLRACSRYGMKAALDIHTYPGGTSLGTFSGVWPRKPLFWKYDRPEDPETDVGRRIYSKLLTWIENLSESDPEAFAGVGGITPMNEPAHLAGLFGPGSYNPDLVSFLPSLPADMARDFLATINVDASSSSKHLVSVPDGPHLRVLRWQSDAIAAFRSTSLPEKGIELLVNVHESIFVPSLTTRDAKDPGGRHPQATSIIAAWWRGTTTAKERETWAVMDMHHYHAWEPTCQGAVDGPPFGMYTCGDQEATDAALAQCVSWADEYRDAFDKQLQDEHDKAKLASGEFSASTHHSVLHSCMDVTTLRKSYLMQVKAASQVGVHLFWWSWKMPHGDAFRPAWSFKHLLYLLGVEGFSKPDESDIDCGD